MRATSRWATSRWTASVLVLGVLTADAGDAQARWRFGGYNSANNFAELGANLFDSDERWVDWRAEFRVRGALMNNLDLDRGVTPSGEPLFPVPLSDPTAQLVTHADMRARFDFGFHAPGTGVALRLRIDALDNVVMGSRPDGPPAATVGQTSDASIVIRRAYAEAALPIGVLAAGRMGSHWGMGLLTHGGGDPDSDRGDAADRIAFATPIARHVWATSLDISSTGPQTRRRGSTQVVDVDPSDQVWTWTFAVMRWLGERGVQRRLNASRPAVEYGAYLSYRWQDQDVPSSYLPVASPVPLTRAQYVARGYSAVAGDAWLRVQHPWFRIEAEVALLSARFEQASLLPGVELNGEVEGFQWGFAVETDIGGGDRPWILGVDFGAASGDPAPGFGVHQNVGAAPASPGDLDGPQASPPGDLRYDNFRFHPDYRVDELLFREIVGTVTDAAYVRPHIGLVARDLGFGDLSGELALMAAWALEPDSTPGGSGALGVEIDLRLAYVSKDGFSAEAVGAVLLPGPGFDNAALGLEARVAHVWRLRLGYTL